MVRIGGRTGLAVRSARVALRTARALVLLALTCVAVSSLAMTAIAEGDSLRVRNEATGSMRPLIEVDDLVVYRPIRGADLAVGDVIGFVRPDEPVPITHRVTSVEATDAGTAVTTKGDANASVDRDPAVFADDEVVWRVWRVVPRVGRPLAQISGGAGLPFALGFVALFVCLSFVQRQLPPPGKSLVRRPIADVAVPRSDRSTASTV